MDTAQASPSLVTVPAEPTDEMIIAALEAAARHNRPFEDRVHEKHGSAEWAAASVAISSGALFIAAYKAMIETGAVK